jgi:hypothetical protein
MTTNKNPGAAIAAHGAEEVTGFSTTTNVGPTLMTQSNMKPQPASEPERDDLDVPSFLDRRGHAGGQAESTAEQAEPVSIKKPSGRFDLNKFRAEPAALAGVATLLTALPVIKISDARDFVRLHPDESSYWTGPLCLVNVPIKGQQRDTVHLISQELAKQYLQPATIQYFRLALGANPNGGFFFVKVPCTNLEGNAWNSTNVKGCEAAKSLWTKLSSRRAEGVEGYKIDHAQDPDAFPETKWPTQTLDELLEVTFEGRMILTVDHPAMRRLLGMKQSLK